MVLEYFSIYIISKPYDIDGVGKQARLCSQIEAAENGFYVELGAYDGYFHSPTYYLYAALGWRGVLIEPLPDAYARAKLNRPKDIIVNQLVGDGQSGETLNLGLAGISSSVVQESEYAITLSSTSLSRILDENVDGKRRINLLVLDVEGYEVKVLQGLDFSTHAPDFILCECQTSQSRVGVDSILVKFGYRFKSHIAINDFLWEKTNHQ